MKIKNKGLKLISNILSFLGYGHVSPLSEGAKLFCILFAIIGIPITLIMISACVERLLILTNKMYDLMKQFKCFLNAASGTLNMKLLTYTHLTLIFVFVLVVFFLVPAGVFSYVEKSWNFLDGLYYCFISLTTIGLG
jgi:potassium channel subfamily K protein 1